MSAEITDRFAKSVISPGIDPGRQMNHFIQTTQRLLVLAIAFYALCGVAVKAESWIQDPGLPDSIWVPSVDWRGDTLFALPVFAATDDSLAVAQVVLAWANPALRLDSVKFNTGRWGVVGYHNWTQGGTDTAVALAFLPTQKRLPPGSGPVAQLYFGRDSAFTFDADVAVDTAQIYPQPPLAPFRIVLTAAPSAPFLPTTVVTAVVAYSPCICTKHGDLVEDGEPNALDLSFMIDALFAGGALPAKDDDCPHTNRGDYNCDNSFDVLDLARIIDYIYAGMTGPCDPCSDL